MRAVDFAVGGSTVDGAIVSPYAMGSSLKDFVNDFQGSYGDWTETPGFKWKSEKSLFTFWFGVNDIAISHFEAKHGEEYTRAPLPEVFESYMRSLNTVSHPRPEVKAHTDTIGSSTMLELVTSLFSLAHPSTAPPSISAIVGMPNDICSLSQIYRPSTVASMTCSTLSV